jgi:hypothetical protein
MDQHITFDCCHVGSVSMDVRHTNGMRKAQLNHNHKSYQILSGTRATVWFFFKLDLHQMLFSCDSLLKFINLAHTITFRRLKSKYLISHAAHKCFRFCVQLSSIPVMTDATLAYHGFRCSTYSSKQTKHTLLDI